MSLFRRKTIAKECEMATAKTLNYEFIVSYAPHLLVYIKPGELLSMPCHDPFRRIEVFRSLSTSLGLSHIVKQADRQAMYV